MAYVTRIVVESHRNLRDVDIDLSPNGTPFRHLILTGPNGSGKSSLLEAVASSMVVLAGGQMPSALRQHDPWRSQWRAAVAWTQEDSAVFQEISAGATIAAFLRATRPLTMALSAGPVKQAWTPQQLSSSQAVTPQFLQFLVNKRTEQAYLLADRNEPEAARIERWFEELRKIFAKLLGDDGLKLVFDRSQFMFSFERSDGHTFQVTQLSDGHAAVMSLLGEILLRVDVVRQVRGDASYEPEGVILIDEIEAHLHLELQESILPLLTTLFPKLQFLVATHSSAVISSIPNAVVFDLRSKRAVVSDELRGIRFGTLMREQFGIAEDVDLDTTQKLQALRSLLAKEPRTAEEAAEMQQIAASLSARSATMSLEVYRAMRALGGANGGRA